MSVQFSTVLMTIINFVALFALIIIIYKAVQGLRKFLSRNKEMDKKLDSILNKLDDK